jgi:hypothetical protein
MRERLEMSSAESQNESWTEPAAPEELAEVRSRSQLAFPSTAEPTEAEAERSGREALGFGTELQGRFRYRLMKRMGKGGFSSVYIARCLDADAWRDDVPPERVAVKIVGAPRRQNPVGLLKRELSALLAMQHDRIPRVYDWSVEGDFAFVVMEYFPSGSLKEVISRRGAVEEEAVWRLLADLLSALSAAHKASILHLDIKPANVLLDGNGGYVLTDFGVSQASRMNRGMIPMSVGTPGYRAPEQRTGEFPKYDLRTDLWGVGATAYSMATGFNLAEHQELIQEGSEGERFGLPPISESRRPFSEELEDVVMSMLRIDPDQRPGSVAEVLARVQAIVNGSGFEADTVAATRRSKVDDAELEELVDRLVDPLLLSICRGRGFDRYFVKFEDGESLCCEGEQSYYAYLLLRGTVRVSRAGEEIALVNREGTFLGEVATLTGLERTATMTALGTVWVCVLNAAELERFVTSNPAIGLRVIRDMARRLSRIPGDL